jgi:serine/threonine-protein kinase
VPQPPAVPNVLLDQEIGKGAFGRVFRGRHRTLDIPVAVKLVETTHVQDVTGALREARLMARLDHPNLLRILDAGQSNGGLYLILELMDRSCAGTHALAPGRALDLMHQLLAGLQALHQARILHRDIKPANCLERTSDGRIKLADLGLAVEQTLQSGRPHDLAGTLPFMAPELFDHPPRFGAASDLYALGRTVQCLVLDRDPFPRSSTAALMAWIQKCEPPNVAALRPDLPPPLAELVDSLCARDARERPASAAAAISDLTPTIVPQKRTRDAETTAAIVGSWVLGTEIPGDANFEQRAVTHVRTGAGARLALLKPRRPLARMSPLILASAERASRLSHPGLGQVVDWGVHDGRAFVVTRSQGLALETLVQASGPLDEVEALTITRDLADALAYLHDKGLAYQVVNPLFAVLSDDARTVQLAWPMFCVLIGQPAVVDLPPDLDGQRIGAFDTMSPLGQVDFELLISVPRYAAPESLVRPSRRALMAAADPVVRITTQADLYGLGEILYLLVAGVPACPPTLDIQAIVYRKAVTPPRLRDAVPAVLAPIDLLAADLIAPDPAARPASAAAVRDRIDRILRGLK